MALVAHIVGSYEPGTTYTHPYTITHTPSVYLFDTLTLTTYLLAHLSYPLDLASTRRSADLRARAGGDTRPVRLAPLLQSAPASGSQTRASPRFRTRTRARPGARARPGGSIQFAEDPSPTLHALQCRTGERMRAIVPCLDTP